MIKRYSRQSFLGPGAEATIGSAKIGVVGLNGGGSQLVQQVGHPGFRRFVLYDPERIDAEGSNLNRNTLATIADVEAMTLKVDLAERKLRGLHRDLEIEAHGCRWQDRPEPLRSCDVIFGCVDTFAGRAELEVCARRYLIPYIDIGLDVVTVDGQPPRMAGQVILSMPGGPCMRCLGFLTDERIAREAARYGDAGDRPQVVWANGVLASTALGIAVDLLTDWTRSLRGPVYLSYDGNTGTMTHHVRVNYLSADPCPHFPVDGVGEPRFRSL